MPQRLRRGHEASKHHTKTLLANTFHSPGESQVLQKIAAANGNHNSFTSEETLRSVNGVGFSTSHGFDRILKPGARSNDFKKNGRPSLTPRDIGEAWLTHCDRVAGVPLHD